ncbi:uncharacterized protein PHALS_05484 [Plasmopara halstedii]|uniref:Uncharacterized protein n=1 Tax=Plasmopara halstedii TaxID=4781 RepID=A0A0P1B0T2_PLAHL|nr:uncharacterized protein PHALS_05484 [Plasmopara halstedii]CEG48002.1 hypothetical protein PHALS_05484 [Plasmopara halstedii]|eukprot:XP_024584371.1 hypothetical protein PHALS_05484 [Plasmopara halstedii]
MNSLLFLYLHLFRGPQIVAARLEKEEKKKRAQLEADIASGKVPKIASCKKCDAPVDRLVVPIGFNPTCSPCLAKETEELNLAKMKLRRDVRMSPFLWFRLFIILLGLTVFFHRNVMPLF